MSCEEALLRLHPFSRFPVSPIHWSIERKSRVTSGAFLPSDFIHTCIVTCIFTSNNGSTKPGWQHYCRSEANYSRISPWELQRLFGFPASLMIPGEAAPLPLGSLLVFAMTLVLTMLNTSCLPSLRFPKLGYEQLPPFTIEPTGSQVKVRKWFTNGDDGM